MEQKSTVQKRLTAEQVREIRSPKNKNKTTTELAKEYGVSWCTINSIQQYITWRKLDE